MLIVGLIVLTIGAEILVRSASALARAARVSPLVIGLTVVAYGTSTPELVVSVQSSLRGDSAIALGNVVGSNIFNVLFILGVSALIVPLSVSQQLVRFDVPLMIALSALTGAMAIDGALGFWDGLALMAGLIAYTTFAVAKSRGETEAVQQEYASEYGASPVRGIRGVLIQTGLAMVGLALLVVGSDWFTDASIAWARQLGVSELVIGLTIVAAGTSLPEVATSLTAALRGERDIAVGNVVGSNIFNIMGVLGLSGLVAGEGVGVSETALHFDIPVMIAVAFACLPIFFTGNRIARWEGGLFLAYYVAYTGYLIAAEVNPEMTRTFEVIMLGFIAPITVVTLAVTSIQAIRASR